MTTPHSTDTKFTDHRITRVDPGDGRFTLGLQDGGGIGVPNESGMLLPKVGDVARLYGNGFGSVVRGVVVLSKVSPAGVVVGRGQATVYFYRTEAEDKAHRQAEAEKEREKRKAEYAANVENHDARIMKLPGAFQKRLTWFRAGVTDWGPNFEGYELFCCEQAALLLQKFETAEDIIKFQQGAHELQREILPELSEHNGNTFSCACGLAKLYLHDQELVPSAHGAMCALVGCQEYGCYAARKDPS